MGKVLLRISVLFDSNSINFNSLVWESLESKHPGSGLSADTLDDINFY